MGLVCNRTYRFWRVNACLVATFAAEWLAHFVPECQSETRITSSSKWRTLKWNKWQPFQRNTGDLSSGMGGVLCSGIVAYYGAEYPLAKNLNKAGEIGRNKLN